MIQTKTYDPVVSEIRDFPWKEVDPNKIVYLSWVTAVEFAETLRTARGLYSESEELQKMALGELKTNNLSYGDYIGKIGDHCEFLSHFICSNDTLREISTSDTLYNAAVKYKKAVSRLTEQERAMTIFSREQELPGIFTEILKSHDWEKHGLGFYEYYIKRHIELDSEDGGHGDLTKDFPLNEEALLRFYEARLELYQVLKA